MINEIEKRLWNAADQLRANSRLKSSEYSVPVLGLIFLRFADYKFTLAEKEIEKQRMSSRRGITKADYQAKGILYLPENARFSYLLNLPEGENIGKAISDAMKAIEIFPEDEYRDIPGLCRVATIEEIIDQGYSLNPGRYVGVAEKEEEDFDFNERLHELNEELERLNAEAHELEGKIAENVVKILEGRPNERDSTR